MKKVSLAAFLLALVILLVTLPVYASVFGDLLKAGISSDGVNIDVWAGSVSVGTTLTVDGAATVGTTLGVTGAVTMNDSCATDGSMRIGDAGIAINDLMHYALTYTASGGNPQTLTATGVLPGDIAFSSVYADQLTSQALKSCVTSTNSITVEMTSDPTTTVSVYCLVLR